MTQRAATAAARSWPEPAPQPPQRHLHPSTFLPPYQTYFSDLLFPRITRHNVDFSDWVNPQEYHPVFLQEGRGGKRAAKKNAVNA